MIEENFKKQIFNDINKNKILNFLGVPIKYIVENQYIFVKFYPIVKTLNLENLIDVKLKEDFGEIKDLLVNYDILKINRKYYLILYVIKENNKINNILKKFNLVKIIPKQIEIAEKFKINIKNKNFFVMKKEKNKICFYGFIKRKFIKYDEVNNSKEEILKIFYLYKSLLNEFYIHKKLIVLEKEILEEIKDYITDMEVKII